MNAYQAYLLDSLQSGADAFAGAVRHFPSGYVDWSPAEGWWNLRELVHHVRFAEMRYLERLEGVLVHGEYVPAPYALPTLDPAEEVDEMVAGYLAVRTREIELAQSLTDAQWKHSFEHPTLWGTISVEFLVERMVTHTAEHTADVWRLRQLLALEPERRKTVLGVV